MRYTRNIIVAALLLSVWLPARAQFAGPDKKVLKTNDNNLTVTIGQAGSGSGECYEWSGPHITSDIHQAVITVKPKEREEIYIVKKTDCNGVEYDQVVVTLQDTVSIVSVTAKKCVNDGDTITSDIFEIVTDPPGYASMATFTPMVAMHDPGSNNPESQQLVSCRIEYNGHTAIKTAYVHVIKENTETSDFTVSVEFKNLNDKIEEFEKCLKKAKAAMDGLLVSLSKNPVGPKPDCDIDWERNYGIPTFSCYCCQGEKVNTTRWPSFGVSGNFHCELEIPIPQLTIPCVAGVSVVFNIAAIASVGPVNLILRGQCSDIEIPIQAGIEISGGARAWALHKDFLSFTGYVTGGVNRTFTFTLSQNKWDVGLGNVEIRLDYEAKTLGMAALKKSVKLKTWNFD